MNNEKEITIFIGKKSFPYKKKEVCYKDVVKLFGKKTGPGEKPKYTVTYQGSKLLKGNCIDAVDGMVFSIGNTKGS